MIDTKFITYQEFLDNYKHNEFVVGYDKDEYVVMVTREGNVRLYLYISDFPYYFCVRLKDVQENKQIFSSLKKARFIDRYEIEGDYVKLFVKTTARYATRDNRDAVLDYLETHRIQTYEADLSPYQRMHVDLKLTVATKYKTLFFDIETDDRGKGIVIGARRIVSIGAVDDEGKEFYWTGEEDEILRCFFRKLEHYDLLTGWNSEKFDIPYVKARAKLLKGKVPWYNWRKTVQVDMMQKMMEIHKRNVELIKEVRSFSL
ncbi:MAG: 3'-5' exonuclease, partial [Saccharofermentanales bacterium]